MAAMTRLDLPVDAYQNGHLDLVPLAPNPLPPDDEQMCQIYDEEIERIQAQVSGFFHSYLVKLRVRRYIQEMVGGSRISPSVDDTARAAADERVLVTRGNWDADAVRDALRCYVAERLASPRGVLVVNELGFSRQGRAVAGAARQVNEASGRRATTEVGMFLTYAARDVFAVVDRELYLPPERGANQRRRRITGVPKASFHRSKAVIAGEMLKRTLLDDLPVQWVAGSHVLGSDTEFRALLEASGQPYVLSVGPEHETLVTVGDESRLLNVHAIAGAIMPDAWTRLNMKDSFLSGWEWARIRLDGTDRGGPARWLVLRRRRDTPTELRYDLSFGPSGTTLETIGRVQEARAASQLSLEMARTDVGLGLTRVRSWDGWYRHITLALVGLAALSIIRSRSRSSVPALAPATNPGVPVEFQDDRAVALPVPERHDTVIALESRMNGHSTPPGSNGTAAVMPIYARPLVVGGLTGTSIRVELPPPVVAAKRSLAPVAIAFLLAVTLAEIVTSHVDLLAGIMLHIVILVTMAMGIGRSTDASQRAFLMPLMLAPMIRIVSLGLPLGSLSTSWRFLLPSIPLFAASVLVMRALALNRTQVGLCLPKRRHLLTTIAVAASGVLLGAMEYRILGPENVLDSTSVAVWMFPVAAIFIGSGLLEELMFRGIMQSTAQKVFGARMAILYISAIFAVLHVGHLSIVDIAFVFGVALYFGAIVRVTGTLAGVVVAHGLTNVVLFLVFPSL